MWVMHVNSFAAPLVKVQSERGHHVINTGPYAWVRHPMYTGAICFFIGMPLLLGSLWGLMASPLLALMFAIRVGIEERTLREGLEGYNRLHIAGALSPASRRLVAIAEDLRMPDSKTYTGGCHCGMVRFECTTDLAMVTACNCSICTKKGLHFAFLAPKSFQLRAGDENLKEYLFNKHAIRHQLCIDCGVDVFARGSKPDGTEVVALNVSCIDGVELAKLTMTPIDGRNR